MAKVLTDQTNYTNIANAIRSKNGKTDKYTPAQMPDAIKAITTGLDESVLAGLIDGSLTTLRVPDAVTSIRDQAFAGMSGLTLNINAAYNGISGKPWGATTPTINWLKATKAKVTITQSEHQTITVTTDDGVAHTESFDGFVGMTFTVKVVGDTGYMGGTPSVTSGTISGAVTITATAATVLKLQTQPWTVNKNNANADNTFAIKIDDGTIYPLSSVRSSDDGYVPSVLAYPNIVNVGNDRFVIGTSLNDKITYSDFSSPPSTPLGKFMQSRQVELSSADYPIQTILHFQGITSSDVNWYWVYDTPSESSNYTSIRNIFNNGKDIIIDFVNPSGGGQ